MPGYEQNWRTLPLAWKVAAKPAGRRADSPSANEIIGAGPRGGGWAIAGEAGGDGDVANARKDASAAEAGGYHPAVRLYRHRGGAIAVAAAEIGQDLAARAEARIKAAIEVVAGE